MFFCAFGLKQSFNEQFDNCVLFRAKAIVNEKKPFKKRKDLLNDELDHRGKGKLLLLIFMQLMYIMMKCDKSFYLHYMNHYKKYKLK